MIGSTFMPQIISRRQLLAGTAAWAAAARPNIVLVLADDMGYGDLACYNPDARTRTPNFDRLARQGVRFTDAHSPSGVCTPTRYGLLTSQYCWRTRLKSGVLNGTSPSLIEPGRETIASYLKKQGYRTGVFGKWHLGLGNDPVTDYSRELRPAPADFGFDRFFGIPASLDMPPYLYIQDRRAVEQPTATIGDSGAPPRGPFWRGGPIAPGFKMDEVLPRITEEACRFIRESKGKQPFFAYVPLTGPHTPWVPTKRFLGRSKANLWGDFVEQVDDTLGQIVRAAGDDALVIATSDNGAPWVEQDVQAANGHRADLNWRGQKSDIYEGGHRIPLIWRWPDRRQAGTVSKDLVCLTDVFATLAGRPLEDGVPLGQRKHVVHHSGNGTFAIREGDWKLVLGRGSGGFTKPQKIEPKPGEPVGELYNLAEDPREERNLFLERPRETARLTQLIASLR
jgi:arylsulfatase A-like enzyme